MGFAAGAQAAILVSNIGQREIVSRTAHDQTWRAQPFQTGTNVDAGYVLESVELELLATTLGPPTVSIRRDAGGDPSGRDLLYPEQFRSNQDRAEHLYRAQHGAKLDANATYWVVVQSTIFKVVRSDTGIGSGAAAGWTILPRHEQRENGRWVLGRLDSGFSGGDGGGVMKIRVNGTERDDLVCDRTRQVRTAILAKVAGISNCGDVMAAHLVAITGTLNLDNSRSSANRIVSLKPGDFDGLTALTGLDFDFNNLRTLPAGIFDDLTALTDLKLSHNSLTRLQAGIFDNLTALEGVGLGNMGLTTLPAGVFDELTALETLGLSGNRLTMLPAVIFDELTALETLGFASNNLRTLPAVIFDNLTALEMLGLGNIGLITLTENIFAELTALSRGGLFLFLSPGAPFEPVANAGPDQTVSSGTAVSLPGAATGPWGNNVGWG